MTYPGPNYLPNEAAEEALAHFFDALQTLKLEPTPPKTSRRILLSDLISRLSRLYVELDEWIEVGQ